MRGAKASIWEGGHRVPLIIHRHDGVLPVKKKRRKVVSLNDLYATICELVGMEVVLHRIQSVLQNISDGEVPRKASESIWVVGI